MEPLCPHKEGANSIKTQCRNPFNKNNKYRLKEKMAFQAIFSLRQKTEINLSQNIMSIATYRWCNKLFFLFISFMSEATSEQTYSPKRFSIATCSFSNAYKIKQGDFHKPPCPSNYYILTLNNWHEPVPEFFFLQCLPTEVKVVFAEVCTITTV